MLYLCVSMCLSDCAFVIFDSVKGTFLCIQFILKLLIVGGFSVVIKW